MSTQLEIPHWAKYPRCETCRQWTHRPLPLNPLMGACQLSRDLVGTKSIPITTLNRYRCKAWESAVEAD